MNEIEEVLSFLREKHPDEASELSEALRCVIEIIDDVCVKILESCIDDCVTLSESDLSDSFEECLALKRYKEIFEYQIDELRERALEEKTEDIQKNTVIKKEYTLRACPTDETPRMFSLRGMHFVVKDWDDFWMKICESLYEMNSAYFHSLPSDRTLVSDETGESCFTFVSNASPSMKMVKESRVYVETDLLSDEIVKKCSRLLEIYKIDSNDLKICFREGGGR